MNIALRIVFFAARRGIINALYIIFLGIIPLFAIVIFLLFYTKHNLKFSWQKSPVTSYVYLFFAFIRSACKGDGLQKNIPTVSQQVASNTPKNVRNLNVDIEPAGLIWTTNREGINKSTNINNEINFIDNKRRLSFKALRSSLKLNTSLRHAKTSADKEQLHCKTPDTAETTVSTPDDVPVTSVKNIAKQFENSGFNITSERC